MTTHEVSTVRLRSLVISQVALFLTMGILMAGVLVATDNSRQTDKAILDKAAASQIFSCERGKKIFTYSIVDAGRNAAMPVQRQEAALKLLPFTDCEATQKKGATVPLSSAAKKAFIDDIAKALGVSDWDVTDNK